jgi:hypothetical protein
MAPFSTRRQETKKNPEKTPKVSSIFLKNPVDDDIKWHVQYNGQIKIPKN